MRNKFSSGGENKGGGVGLALTAKLSSSVGRDSRRAVDESLRQDREEETTSLAGTSLGTSHEITATHDNGDGVFLNGSRDLVAGHLNVAAKVLIQRRSGELVDRLGDVTTRGFDRDIVVLLKVDTGVLLGRIVGSAEELTLDTGVGGTRNVLSVPPLSVSRAASRVATTTVAAFISGTAATARVASATTPAATTTTTVVLITGSISVPVGALTAAAVAALATVAVEKKG